MAADDSSRLRCVSDYVVLKSDYHLYSDALNGPLKPGDIDFVECIDIRNGVIRARVILVNGHSWFYDKRVPCCAPDHPGGAQASSIGTQMMPAGSETAAPTAELPLQRASGAEIPDSRAAVNGGVGGAPAAMAPSVAEGDSSSSVGALVVPLENIVLDSSRAEDGNGAGHEADSAEASTEQEEAAVRSCHSSPFKVPLLESTQVLQRYYLLYRFDYYFFP